MRPIARISEDEMVALFLRTEIQSMRWEAALLKRLDRDRVAREIVDHPDTTDPAENEYRLRLLGETRGYRRNKDLFENFPENVVWERVALTRDELWQIKYIDYDYWVKLSRGSRLAVEAARTIRAGETVFGVPNDGFLNLASALRGGAVVPELILVRAGEGANLVVLEGHLRLTAYALAPEVVPEELTAVMGTSPEMAHWDLYEHSSTWGYNT